MKPTHILVPIDKLDYQENIALYSFSDRYGITVDLSEEGIKEKYKHMGSPKTGSLSLHLAYQAGAIHLAKDLLNTKL